MNILVICQYYYPEPFRISDICEELVKRGHKVTVVTGTPNYPMGEIYEGYEKGKHKYQKINGVNVHRCFTIGRKGGTVKRFLNYYSYAISSSLHTLFLRNNYDVVFVNQLSPVMMAYAGIIYKRIHKKKLIMYCLDLWPASLSAGGINSKSVIYNIFKIISARIYKSADKILITSKSFDEYFCNEFGIKKNKISYLPQYAEQLFDSKRCYKKAEEWTDLMFAGNIGKVQNVQIIVEAASRLLDYKIRFHIVGDGTDFQRIKAIAKRKKLKNVIFYGRQPLEKMPEYYSKADAMFVTLENDPVLSMTLPGKVQTYMAAGKPIIGSINGETQMILRESGCGYCGEAENVDSLVSMIISFVNNKNKEQLGLNARSYYEKNFSKHTFIKKLENELGKAI